MTDKILSRSEVLKIVGFSARTLYYEIAAGRFPRQVQISKRRVGWRLSDLQAWLDERRSREEVHLETTVRAEDDPEQRRRLRAAARRLRRRRQQGRRSTGPGGTAGCPARCADA